MWYKIDLVKLVSILTPPILRSKFLFAFLCVLVLPLRYVYSLFAKHKSETDRRLNITANVANLEVALNKLFFLTEGQIYITTPEEDSRQKVLYFKTESQRPFYMYTESEKKKTFFVQEYEASAQINFIIMVPTFLCTSIDSKEMDDYGWMHLDAIKKLLSIYKPAGRTFCIKLYDYE